MLGSVHPQVTNTIFLPWNLPDFKLSDSSGKGEAASRSGFTIGRVASRETGLSGNHGRPQSCHFSVCLLLTKFTARLAFERKILFCPLFFCTVLKLSLNNTSNPKSQFLRTCSQAEFGFNCS